MRNEDEKKSIVGYIIELAEKGFSSKESFIENLIGRGYCRTTAIVLYGTEYDFVYNYYEEPYYIHISFNESGLSIKSIDCMDSIDYDAQTDEDDQSMFVELNNTIKVVVEDDPKQEDNYLVSIPKQFLEFIDLMASDDNKNYVVEYAGNKVIITR